MKHPTPDYPIVAFGEALQSLTGAGIAMFTVCAIGGAVPTVAGWRYLPGTEDWAFLTIGWIWHWAIAGLMFWGLLALLVPVWSFHELLHGNGNPFLALAATLITQLVVSTVAVCIVEQEYERVRPIIASSCSILLVGAITIRLLRAEMRNRPRERSVRAPRHKREVSDDRRDSWRRSAAAHQSRKTDGKLGGGW